ncbi:MAG: DUF1272 domain-containing protein [Saprospiraceae bacterium]|nr:DUF1272 domain-containing protein [Saprospiraceae bacterium]
MLELRPCCERCGQDLQPDNPDAMICTFECTFCTTCVTTILHDVCPNCGGNFSPRPIRPQAALTRHPASTVRIIKPLDMAKFNPLLAKYKTIPPAQR